MKVLMKVNESDREFTESLLCLLRSRSVFLCVATVRLARHSATQICFDKFQSRETIQLALRGNIAEEHFSPFSKAVELVRSLVETSMRLA